MESAQFRNMRLTYLNRLGIRLTVALGVALGAVLIGCSSGSTSPRDNATPLPLDEDARRMLLEPLDLPDDHWVPGGRDDVPLPTPTACDSPAEGRVGRAQVELENLSDGLTQEGFYENISVFDSPAAAILWLNGAADYIRCLVDQLNRSQADSTAVWSTSATLTLLPPPLIGDSSVAYEIAIAEDLRRLGPTRSDPDYYIQAVAFVDETVYVSVSVHALLSPLDQGRIVEIAQAALNKERSARGLLLTPTPTP